MTPGLSYFLGLAAARGHRELLDRVLAKGGQVSLEHLEKAEAQGEDATALFLLEQMGGELSALIEQAKAENRTELAAYLEGLRRARIGRVIGPAVAAVALLFVLLVLAYFLRKHVLQSPAKLYDAIAKGRLEALEKLLGAGADPNGTVRGEPLLHAAVARANGKAVRLLLRHRADVDRPAEEPAADSGLTALHLAAPEGQRQHGHAPATQQRAGRRPYPRRADTALLRRRWRDTVRCCTCWSSGAPT